MDGSTKSDFGSVGRKEIGERLNRFLSSDIPSTEPRTYAVEYSSADTRPKVPIPCDDRADRKWEMATRRELIEASSESSNSERNLPPQSEMLESSEVLVRRFYDRLYAYCFRLSGRHADAEDLCQQVFVSLLRHRHKIHTPDAIEGWLATTARRSYWYTLKQRSQQSIVQLDQIDGLLRDDSSAIDEFERKDWVHSALERLSPLARIILVMFYFEEKTYQQISEELEIPIGTVMSRLSRGKLALRDALLETSHTLLHDSSGSRLNEDLQESIGL